MLYWFKFEKLKIAYDTVSGAIVSLSSLEYKMIQAITPPLSPICPSSLRYELAKYDSADVEEAYDRLYNLFRDELLFASEQDNTAKVRIGGKFGLTNNTDLAKEIALRLGTVTPRFIIATGTDSEMVSTLCALF